ncbi:MAG: right-handed parallel beta-helix repeat-containing protein [Acidobacteriota bacterium]
MRRAVTILILAGGLTALAIYGVTWGQAPGQRSKLPGAKSIIEASQFSSLQAAIDAIPADGGVLQLTPGLFEITQPLVITQQDLLIRGSGTATHIQNLNQDGQPALIIRPADVGSSVTPEPQWRIHLADFRITGNEKSGQGIVAVRVNELYLEGLTVSRHGGDGIVLDHCYEDPRVANCLITYNKGTGLNLLGCHDIVVNGNQFEENQDALRCIDGFNLCMTGNNLDDHLGHGVVIENTYGSVVSGNMIEECAGTAIVLDRDSYGNTLSANVIAHNGAGIDLRDAHGSAVSANTFTIMKSHALRLGPKSSRITVTGNNFSNSYIGEGQMKREADDLAAAGVTLAGASHVVFSGNLFGGVRPKALSLENSSSQGILFSNNVIVDAQSDHSQLKNDSLVKDNLDN